MARISRTARRENLCLESANFRRIQPIIIIIVIVVCEGTLDSTPLCSTAQQHTWPAIGIKPERKALPGIQLPKSIAPPRTHRAISPDAIHRLSNCSLPGGLIVLQLRPSSSVSTSRLSIHHNPEWLIVAIIESSRSTAGNHLPSGLLYLQFLVAT